MKEKKVEFTWTLGPPRRHPSDDWLSRKVFAIKEAFFLAKYPLFYPSRQRRRPRCVALYSFPKAPSVAVTMESFDTTFPLPKR